MRAGIRKQILENVKVLQNCYEPNVPRPETPKPYGVVVQGADSPSQDPTSFERTVEVWLYNDIETFQTLDELADETIKALHLKTFEDPNTGIAYTTAYKGTVGAQDMVDEEWGAIVRGLSFTIIALYESKTSQDLWESATADFINEKLNIKTYKGTWSEDFQVPSVLCRTINSNRSGINFSLYKRVKDMRIHVVSSDRAEMDKIIDQIEYELIAAIKIPLIPEERRFLTIESIKEDRSANMLGVGQITVTFSRIERIKRDISFIEKISGRQKGGLDYDGEEEQDSRGQ